MLREELRRIYGLPEQHYKLYEDPGQNCDVNLHPACVEVIRAF